MSPGPEFELVAGTVKYKTMVNWKIAARSGSWQRIWRAHIPLAGQNTRLTGCCGSGGPSGEVVVVVVRGEGCPSAAGACDTETEGVTGDCVSPYSVVVWVTSLCPGAGMSVGHGAIPCFAFPQPSDG